MVRSPSDDAQAATDAPPLAEAYDLAERQRGVIARFQLVDLLGPAATNHLLSTGRLEPLVRGVWRWRGGAKRPEQLAFAAALRARPQACVSGPVALGLLGTPGFFAADAFEIVTQVGRRLSNVEFPHRAEPGVRRGTARYGAVRVAGPLDALIDTAAFTDGVTDRDVRVAWDHLRGTGLATVDRLHRRLDARRAYAPGVVRLETLLEQGGGARVESEGERTLAPLLSCFDPPFLPQVWVTPGRRVDFFNARCRFGYEYLGKVDHGAVAQRLADDARDAELRREGIRLGYVTKADLDEPLALFATIVASLTVRAHELGVEAPVAVRRPAI